MVVIAEAEASVDSGDSPPENPWKADMVGVNTTFHVAAVLKGKVEGDKFRVFHYRLKPGVLTEDGPLLVSFRQHGININTREAEVALGRPDYLLFLRKRKDGRYEPVSGQVDPVLSVREMYSPLPAELGPGQPE